VAKQFTILLLQMKYGNELSLILNMDTYFVMIVFVKPVINTDYLQSGNLRGYNG
jgi:hypothetical protein